MEEKFKLETQWQKYLEMVGLSEAKMPEDQKREMKRAFMGACGLMLILLRDEVGELDDNEAVKVLDGFMTQLENFWTKSDMGFKFT